MNCCFKAILPLDFSANGVAAGIKKSGKLDLALIYSFRPAKAACMFTANTMIAAPLQVNKKYLSSGRLFHAILVNSGNANCFTGAKGLQDAEASSACAAKYLGVSKKSVLVNSTGIIGRKLPVEKIKSGLGGLVSGLGAKGIDKAKQAILTTDTFAKEITVKFSLAGRTVTLCGIAKGAGMIAPNMATMLAFIVTDASLAQGALNRALKEAVSESFNCITVDGCMSTNDSVMVLANGAAKNTVIKSGAPYLKFVSALKVVCLALAKMIVRDAEGGTKFIQIDVRCARTIAEAKLVAMAIANSDLFKTAMYGENPNFGRIVAAVGASGVEVREKDLTMKVSPLHKKEILVQVGLGRGKSKATVYTSDLTEGYIKINAEYN